MGASEFINVAEGKTADEAFKKLVAQAQWEHGHGGYSGTIAEKQSFVEFARPKGMPRDKVIEAGRALGGYARRRWRPEDGRSTGQVPKAAHRRHVRGLRRQMGASVGYPTTEGRVPIRWFRLIVIEGDINDTT